MPNQVKIFSLEEANRLVPVLNQLLPDLRKRRDEIINLEVQIDAMELVTASKSSRGMKEITLLIKKHHELVGEFCSRVDQVHGYQCFLKDIDLGLIDFYGMVGGKLVYYCWQVGEDKINFWHDVGKGFADRQAING
jgi:hypothetical protein